MATVERIKWIDALKCIAIIGIVFLHSFNFCHPIIRGFDLYDLHQLGRFGVPLFILVSGTLLLGRKDYDYVTFLKKRFIRICYPLIFFIVIAMIFGLYDNPLVAFWYCWMILGVYLSIPFINKIILNSSMRELEYLIAIGLFASIFYQIMLKSGIYFSLDLNFFVSPLLYLVLGYYLSKKEFNIKPNKIIALSAIVFIISTVCKIYLGNSFDVYPTLKVMYVPIDLSIMQILQCCSVFLFFKYLYGDVSGISLSLKNVLTKDSINKAIVSIGRSSYGIYLVHILFLIKWIRPFPKEVVLTNKEMALFCGISFIAILIVSWLIVIILSRIPFIKKFSGYA